MKDTYDQIKKLHETLQTLLKQHKNLKKENEHLKGEIENLRKTILEKNNLIENSRQKSDAVNLVSLHPNHEKKQLQQKVDIYLKDIERCLSLLNA